MTSLQVYQATASRGFGVFLAGDERIEPVISMFLGRRRQCGGHLEISGARLHEKNGDTKMKSESLALSGPILDFTSTKDYLSGKSEAMELSENTSFTV